MASHIQAELIYKNIIKSYTIPDAYENWSEYRARITDYLIRYIEPGKSVAILGVGESNDIDLRLLYEHTGNLTLVDKNIDSMKNALSIYGLESVENIRLICQDFVGIKEQEYIELIGIILDDIRIRGTSCLTSATLYRFIDRIQDIYSNINSRDINLGIDIHDYIIAIGLTSQLNNLIPHIWNSILASYNMREMSVNQCVTAQNDYYIPRFCKTLESHASSRLFLGSEIRTLEAEGGVEGAAQTFEYFNNKSTKEKESIKLYKDIWPLYPGKTYEMGIINLSVRLF